MSLISSRRIWVKAMMIIIYFKSELPFKYYKNIPKILTSNNKLQFPFYFQDKKERIFTILFFKKYIFKKYIYMK